MKPEEEEEEEGANIDLDAQRQGKCVVLKTSTRQTIFLPVVGLVDANELRPSDLVGVNKDSYLILDKLPAEYDSRVKAMEVILPVSLPSLLSYTAVARLSKCHYLHRVQAVVEARVSCPCNWFCATGAKDAVLAIVPTLYSKCLACSTAQ